MFASYTERLEARIEACVNSFEDRIVRVERSIDTMKEDCNTNVDNLVQSVNEIRSDHLLKLQHLGRLERSQDLVITGIPYQRTEDLNQIFRDIARCIDVERKENHLVHLKRLSKHPVRSGSSPPILCQFAHRGSRDEFFRKYLHSRSLKLHHAGFQGNGRIYINESLTQLTRTILKFAIELRSKGRLHRVCTKNGIVSVVFHEDGKAVVVDSLDQLLLLKSNLSK